MQKCNLFVVLYDYTKKSLSTREKKSLNVYSKTIQSLTLKTKKITDYMYGEEEEEIKSCNKLYLCED